MFASRDQRVDKSPVFPLGVRRRVGIELGVFARAARYVPRIGFVDRKAPSC